ncbi:MAG: translation initiation factor IF-3 [bacterium]
MAFFKPYQRFKKERLRVNERIRVKRVRLIDENGKQIGVIDTGKALEIARQRGYDLVEISPNADPPVCKLIDYGRYKYEQAKKERVQRKTQRQMTVKEVKFRPKTDSHDYKFKLKHIMRFLDAGHKVRITIWFMGREMAHTEKGRELLDRIIAELGDKISIEKEAKLEGRNLSILVSSKPGTKFQKEEEIESEEEKV